jgi:hypothetical protein
VIGVSIAAYAGTANGPYTLSYKTYAKVTDLWFSWADKNTGAYQLTLKDLPPGDGACARAKVVVDWTVTQPNGSLGSGSDTYTHEVCGAGKSAPFTKTIDLPDTNYFAYHLYQITVFVSRRITATGTIQTGDLIVRSNPYYDA